MDSAERTIEYKTLAYRPVTDDLKEGEFAGYVAARGIDSAGDMILQGAFRDTIADYVQNGFVAWQHQWDEPIGKPLEAYEDEKGLYVKGRISDTARGRDALTLLRDGVVSKMSIGYTVTRSRHLSDAEGTSLLGEEGYKSALEGLPWTQDKIRALEGIKLYESSFVSVPANPGAHVLTVKGAGSPYSDHFSMVQAAIEDFLARTQDLMALRAKDGRQISAANRQKLAAMREHLAGHIGLIDEFLAQTTPPTDPDLDERVKTLRREYVRFLKGEAALHGAL